MARVGKNRGLLLATLVAVWGVLLIWQFGRSSEPERVSLTHVSGKLSGPRTVASQTAPPRADLQVHLEQLATIKGQRQATFATPRNIFASLQNPTEPPPAPAPRRKRPRGSPPPSEVLVPTAEVAEPETDAEPEPAEAPPEGPKGPTPEEIERLRVATELSQYRYVGFMAVNDQGLKKKTMGVVFKNDEMHLLAVGDTIAGEVLVKELTPKAITLQDVGSKITHVVTVSEERDATPSNP